jgi:hypothetical protein
LVGIIPTNPINTADTKQSLNKNKFSFAAINSMKVCNVPEAGGGGDGVGNAVAKECRLLQQLADPRAGAT